MEDIKNPGQLCHVIALAKLIRQALGGLSALGFASAGHQRLAAAFDAAADPVARGELLEELACATGIPSGLSDIVSSAEALAGACEHFGFFEPKKVFFSSEEWVDGAAPVGALWHDPNGGRPTWRCGATSGHPSYYLHAR